MIEQESQILKGLNDLRKGLCNKREEVNLFSLITSYKGKRFEGYINQYLIGVSK